MCEPPRLAPWVPGRKHLQLSGEMSTFPEPWLLSFEFEVSIPVAICPAIWPFPRSKGDPPAQKGPPANTFLAGALEMFPRVGGGISLLSCLFILVLFL